MQTIFPYFDPEEIKKAQEERRNYFIETYSDKFRNCSLTAAEFYDTVVDDSNKQDVICLDYEDYANTIGSSDEIDIIDIPVDIENPTPAIKSAFDALCARHPGLEPKHVTFRIIGRQLNLLKMDNVTALCEFFQTLPPETDIIWGVDANPNLDHPFCISLLIGFNQPR